MFLWDPTYIIYMLPGFLLAQRRMTDPARVPEAVTNCANRSKA